MGKISKKRKGSTDTPKLKYAPDSKKQKIQDFTEIEFKVLLKDDITAYDGESLNDN